MTKMFEFKLADVGEGLHEAQVVEILVKPGDRVEEGQKVVVIETDKFTTDLTSPVSGVVEKVNVNPFDTAQVGDTLMVIKND
ncbi:MAG: hypothetical protein E7Y34_00275 [Mycoplasma sp.]|nr:hypothetical protein [Mycoplasma sp.]